MNFQHFLNGRWVEDKDLLIPGKDLAVLRAYGVFDAMRTFKRKVPRLQANLDRFWRSAELLDLAIPYSKEELGQIILKGINKNPEVELAIRPVLTGGVGPDAMTPGKPNLFIIFSKATWPTDEQLTNGVKTITWPELRFLPEAKTLNYLASILANKQAEQSGAIEAFYTDPDVIQPRQIYEGAHTNLFIVKDGQILTPKDSVLKGITRGIAIDLAKQLQLSLSEESIELAKALNADEVFITGASKGVLPVVQIDNQIIKDGKPGPITKQLIKAFNDFVNSL